ncbi:MAG: Tfp pilus assembly protein PilN [Bradymonadia bacterium]|jgi:Tfp pilus assembly protein PilN
MIRINLLPVRQDVKRQYGKQQLLLGVLLIGVELAVLFMLHNANKEQLNEAKSEADNLQVEVDRLNAQAAALDDLNEQKEQLENLASVLENLEVNRSGPVAVMDELKEMLNAPANDLQAVAQARRDWDTDWDPRSVWINSLIESSGEVAIVGKALTNDDVAEFTVRLASSHYFSNVRLDNTRASEQTGLGSVFTFEISANVAYGVPEEAE